TRNTGGFKDWQPLLSHGPRADREQSADETEREGKRERRQRQRGEESDPDCEGAAAVRRDRDDAAESSQRPGGTKRHIDERLRKEDRRKANTDIEPSKLSARCCKSARPS